MSNTLKIIINTINLFLITINISFAQGNTFKLSGNNNIGPNDFLGSTNNAALIFKVNNTEMMRLNPNGSVDFADGVQLNLMGTANLDTIVSKYINTTSLFAAIASINNLNANNGTIINLQSTMITSSVLTSDTVNTMHLNATTIENINIINTDIIDADNGTINQLETINLTTQNLKVAGLSGSGTELVKVQSDGTFERFPLSNNTEEVLTGTGAFRLAPWTLSGNDITSSYSGNVGLGVTDPQYKLHVGGDIKYDGKLQNSIFETDPTTGTVTITGNLETSGTIKSGNSILINGATSGGTYDEILATAGKLKIGKVAGAPVIYDDNIFVGINTDNPQRTLHVLTQSSDASGGGGGGGGNVGTIRIEDRFTEILAGNITHNSVWDLSPRFTNNYSSSYFTITDPSLAAGTEPIFTITSSQRIGISEREPEAKLHIHAATEDEDALKITYEGASNIDFMTIKGDGSVYAKSITVPAEDGSANFKVNEFGQLKCRKVDVTAGIIGDYVFEEDYKLMSLRELEEYVTNNKHLPSIPSAKEIEQNNNEYDLSKMVESLLVKVEELTLYTIEQGKEIEYLKKNKYLNDK